MYFPCIIKGVDELCRAHPKLEHLHLNDNNGYPFCMKDDWMLNHLKTLVYNCSFPRKGNNALVILYNSKLYTTAKLPLLFFILLSQIF